VSQKTTFAVAAPWHRRCTSTHTEEQEGTPMSNSTREHSIRYTTSRSHHDTTLSPEQRVHLHGINNQISVISLTASLMRQNAVHQGTASLRAHIERIAHAAETLDALVQEYVTGDLPSARR
jgi:hypothetical protein